MLYNFSSTPSIAGIVVSTTKLTVVSVPSSSVIVTVYVPSSDNSILPV